MAPKRTHYSDEENDTDEERVVKKPTAKKCKPVKKVAAWKDIKNLCVLLSGFKKGGGRGGRKRKEEGEENAQVAVKFKAAQAAHALDVAAHEATVAADQALEASTGVRAPFRYGPHMTVSMRWLGWKAKDATASLLADFKTVYGDQVDRPPLFKPSAKVPTPPIRDAWHSEWRNLVALHVNNPRIAATGAKKIYKVSDAELLTIPLVAPLATPKSRPRYFITSAVDALAVRSHGGAFGHEQYLIKMTGRAEKAAATREQNGTTVVKTGRKIYHEWGGKIDPGRESTTTITE